MDMLYNKYEKYSLQDLIQIRDVINKLIDSHQVSGWVCTVKIINYDDDWSFRNSNGDMLREGTTVTFIAGKTPQEALKYFVDKYSVEGYHKVLGSNVPDGYGHVKYIREVMQEYINKINNGIIENLTISGNYNVIIELRSDNQKVCTRCKKVFDNLHCKYLCDDCNYDDDATG